MAFAVSILGREKTSIRMREVAEHVIKNIARGPGVARVARGLISGVHFWKR